MTAISGNCYLEPPSELQSGLPGGHWLLLRDQLTEEERLIQDAANGFVEQHLMPRYIYYIYMYNEKNVIDSFLVNRILAANRNEVFDKEIMTELGSQGFLGPTLKGYNCAGVGYVAYGLIANAIGTS